MVGEQYNFTNLMSQYMLLLSRADVIEYMDSVGYNHIQHSGTNAQREEIGTIDDIFIKKGIDINLPKTEL